MKMGNNDDTGDDKEPISSGSSSVNGSKNKRKYLSEFLPDQLNMLSVTESPRYEVLEENSSNEVGLLPVPDSDTGEQEIDGRTNPTVCELRALLSENLRRTFQRAILTMVELGYSKDIAEQTLLKCGLYHGTKDTASNAVEGALIFMKKETSRCNTFQNLDQLVDYTLIEMESVLKEVKPDITDAEALWILLICDMNLLHACLVNENHPCNISLQDLFEEVSRGLFPSKQKPDTFEPSHAFSQNVHLSKSITLNSQTSNSEDLTVGTPTQWSNSKDLDIHEGATKGKKTSVSIRKSIGARESCYLNISKGLPAEEKSAVCRKGPRGSSKREMLGQKLFHVEKCRPRGAFKATVPWSGMVSKPQKLSSSSSGIPIKSAFSEIWPRVRANSPLHKGNSNVPNVSLSVPWAADGPNTLGSEVSVFALPSLHAKDPLSLALESRPMSKTSGDSPGLSEERDSCTGMGSEGSVFALPPLHATAPLSLALEPGPMSNTSGDKPDSSEECDGFTEMPSEEKDENILILSSRLKALDEEIKYWNAWAIEKVKQATLRVSKDQEEIKMLKKEKIEAERLKNDKQGPEDSSQKRISEIKNATNNTTEQLAIINSTILSLDKGNSELRIKLEAAEMRASKATKNLKEAEVMQMDALKRSQAIDKEKIFLKEELTALKQQAADMRSQLERTEEPARGGVE